jgi:hypothetical protein
MRFRDRIHSKQVVLGVLKPELGHGQAERLQPPQAERFAVNPVGAAVPVDGHPQLGQGLFENPRLTGRLHDPHNSIRNPSFEDLNVESIVGADDASRPQILDERIRVFDIQLGRRL